MMILRSRVRWKVFSLVRDPIARAVSDFFQNVEYFWPDALNPDGQVDIDRARTSLMDRLSSFDPSSDYCTAWFDGEFRHTLGVDVYGQALDANATYWSLDSEVADIVIVRLEDLSEAFRPALASLGLEANRVQLIKVHEGSSGRHGEAYKRLLDGFVVPRAVASRMYASKYSTTFYTTEQRQQFLERWCGRAS